MNEEFAALLQALFTQQDATRVAPTKGRGEGPGFLRSTGRVASDAVLGLPELIAGILMQAQRDPLAFTPVGDVREGMAAAEEGDFLRSGILALLSASGLGGMGRRVGQSAARTRMGSGSGREGLDTTLRDRRGFNSPPRTGGRRAGDPESDVLMEEASKAALAELTQRASRRAAAAREVTHDPVAELIRLLNPGGS